MPIPTRSFSHIRLTVTDIARSRAFYEGLFGWPVALEMPAGADEATAARYAFLYGGVIYRFGDCLFGLRPVATDSFDEDRVGLDHLSLAVDSREDLQRAAELLDERGVAHDPVKDAGNIFILQFRDPDNIAVQTVSP